MVAFNSSGTIIGNGEYLAIIVEDNAYVINGYALQNIGINYERGVIDVSCFGSPDLNYCHNPQASTISLEILVLGSIEIVDAVKVQIKDIDKMSIFELFQEINKKIESRT